MSEIKFDIEIRIMEEDGIHTINLDDIDEYKFKDGFFVVINRYDIATYTARFYPQTDIKKLKIKAKER